MIRSQRTPTSRNAFTLLELIVVMAILVVLMAIAYPSLEGWYGSSRVTAAADDIRTSWAEARGHAIAEGVPYRFCIKANEGRFRITPDDDQHWDGNDPDGDTEYEGVGAGPYIRIRTLPKPIRFALTNQPDDAPAMVDASGWTRVATFLPDGTCRENVTIEIDGEGEGNAPVVLHIRGLTGTITMETKKE